MADRVRSRVSLVVLLIDDFNNKVINGKGVRVWIAGARPPLHKPEGYYVFTDLVKGQTEVLVDSGIYERQSVSVSMQETGKPYTMLKIRLIPNRSYLLPPQTTCLEGTAKPGSQIRLFCREESKALKLLFDYSCQGEQAGAISIYHPEAMDIEGKNLFIESRDRSKAEFFQINSCQGSGRYRLAGTLKNDYKKIGTAIYLVHTANTDKKGYFFLPVIHISSTNNEFFCEASSETEVFDRIETVNRSCTLVKGRVNKLTLLKEEG